MELEEGNEFLFSVEKKLTLPDGEYLILLAEFNQKYLLPTQNYSEFNIKVGDKIKCRIDKVNCNGKVFLEPEHPIYKVGDKAVFTVLNEEERVTHKTQDKYLVIKAIGENTKRAIIPGDYESTRTSQGISCLCEVVKIKKGELVLNPLFRV